jgi:hypothetical protein
MSYSYIDVHESQMTFDKFKFANIGAYITKITD